MSKKIIVVAGARPNFMKVAPILAELRRYRQDFQPLLVHTGQHYDRAMSQVFFDQFDLRPDHVLELHPGSGGMQFAQMTTQLVEDHPKLRKPMCPNTGHVANEDRLPTSNPHHGAPRHPVLNDVAQSANQQARTSLGQNGAS